MHRLRRFLPPLAALPFDKLRINFTREVTGNDWAVLYLERCRNHPKSQKGFAFCDSVFLRGGQAPWQEGSLP